MTLALTERLSEIFGAIQAIPADPLVPASTAINTHFFKGMGQVSVLARKYRSRTYAYFQLANELFRHYSGVYVQNVAYSASFGGFSRGMLRVVLYGLRRGGEGVKAWHGSGGDHTTARGCECSDWTDILSDPRTSSVAFVELLLFCRNPSVSERRDHPNPHTASALNRSQVARPLQYFLWLSPVHILTRRGGFHLPLSLSTRDFVEFAEQFKHPSKSRIHPRAWLGAY